MSGKSATKKLSPTALDNVVREAECLYQMGEFLEASRLFVEALKGGEHDHPEMNGVDAVLIGHVGE